MAGNTGISSRDQRPRVADFDEQMWPINCAILILAGFVAGFIIVRSDFSDPRFLYNGYCHMAGVGLLVAILFLGVWWLQGKILRRLQLAILLSLSAHVAAALILDLSPLAVVYEQALSNRPGGGNEPDDPEPENPEEKIVINEWAAAQVEPDDQPQSFEAPMQSAVPDAVLPAPPEVVQEDFTRTVPMIAALPRAPSADLPLGGPGAEPNPKELRRAAAAAQQHVAQVPLQQWNRQTNREVELPNQAPEPAPAVAAGQPAKPAEAAAVMIGRQQPSPRPGSAGRPAAGSPDSAAATVAAAGDMPRRAGEPAGAAVPSQPKPPERAGHDQFAGLDSAAQSETPAAPAGPPGEPGKAPGQPGDTSVAKAPSKLISGGPGTVEPGQALAGMTGDLQLPAALAHRSRGLRTQEGGEDAVNSRPGTLARVVQGGIAMPSTVLAPGEQPGQTPAAAGGSPASRIEATSRVAVERAGPAGAPRGTAIAAAGSEEFGIGTAGRRIARTGMPRGTGEDRPSMSPTGNAPRLAKAPSGGSLGGMPLIEIETRPDVLTAPGSGDGLTPSALAAAPMGVGGTRSTLPGTPRSPGTGLPASSAQGSATGGGTALGPVGVAEPGRLPRKAAIPSATIAGGPGEGGVRGPERANVGGLPDGSAEGSGIALAGDGGSGGGADTGAGGGADTGAGGGRLAGVPLEGNVKGLEPRVPGLPGSVQRTVRMGALAAGSDRGAPLPTAPGQRAVASQPRDAGSATGPNLAATLSRTLSPSGANLPAAAVPVAQMTSGGGGGVMSTPGGATSSLPIGPAATVHRGAVAGAPVGRGTVPIGFADAGSGSGLVVVLPGPISGKGRGVPTLASDDKGSSPGGLAILPRAGLSGTGIPGGVADGGEPSSGTAAKGPAAGLGGGSVEPGPAAAVAINRGSAGLPAAGGAGTAGVPDIAGAAAGPAGAVIGPRRFAQGVEQGAPQGSVAGVARSTRNLGVPDGAAEPIAQQPVALAVGPNPAVDANLGRGRSGANGNGSGGNEPSGPGGGDSRTAGPYGRPTSVPVQVAALGAGGIGESGVLTSAGIPARRGGMGTGNGQMVADSGMRRPPLGRSGGPLVIDGAVKEPTPAYQHRGTGRRRGLGAGEGDGGMTDKTVEVALDFFSRVQFPDGHWSLDKLPEGVKIEDAALGTMQSDTAATGLVLLTYLGGGYTHLDDKHRTLVRRGVDWLVKHQNKTNGDLFAGGSKYTHFYSHGIAAIALCEAYGMTQDPELRGPAQKALDFIVRSQDPRGGGWRYEPGQESDTSVTGWQLMALKSGQMAGLTVPIETLRKIDGWLNIAQAGEGDGRYVYNPYDNRDRPDSFRPSLAMTAESMLMRMYLGRGRDNMAILRGAEYLKTSLPEVGTLDRPLRDCYYWYYATQAMYQMQGDYWTAWNNRLRPLLESGQVTKGELAGTWHPLKPVPDRWGQAGGRIYVTAMHLLMLEVQYRYLPLFQELNK